MSFGAKWIESMEKIRIIKTVIDFMRKRRQQSC